VGIFAGPPRRKDGYSVRCWQESTSKREKKLPGRGKRANSHGTIIPETYNGRKVGWVSEEGVSQTDLIEWGRTEKGRNKKKGEGASVKRMHP